MTIHTKSKDCDLVIKTFTCQESKPKSPCMDDWMLIESPSATEEYEGSKKAFTEKAEQLHAHIDPFHKFYLDLLPIIDYKHSDYKILYMNEGKLDLYMPKLPFGSYPSGDEVVQYVTTIIEKIESFHEKQEQQNKWKVLKIARRTLPCLQEIIDNYSDISSYDKFTNGLQKQYNQLEEWIATSSVSSSSLVDDYIEYHYGYSIFDLIDIHGDTYPKAVIIKTLKEYYGERLTNFAIDRFLSEEKTTSQLAFNEEEGLCFIEDADRISFNQVYGLIFSIATNVKREDLKWKYEKNKKDATSFEKLSAEEIDKLLIYFRCAPDGHNLFDYFGIRISLDKHTVDSAYLEIFPAEDMEEQSRLNEMSVYADIESSKIWHPGQVILMTDIQMFDQLNMIFSHPYNSQLFHSDRYISFLNVAATCIAYLQSFKANKEAIDANLPILIKKLEDIANHAHEMYPDGFIARYKSHLLTLIGKLKDARRDPNINLSNYYLSLFAHPLQNDEDQLKTLKLHRQLQSFEFLARKVAYWNWNYQTNEFFIDDKGKLKNPKQMQHRVGTLFHVSAGTSMELYEVKELIIKDGFCCQLCTPYDTDKYVKSEKPIPIKITFQGTINSPLSTARDFYVKGAGYELWLKEKTKLVIPELRDLMADLRQPYEHGMKPTFCLDYVGHSLGGSDAQNAAAYLSETFLTRNIKSDWISQINVHTFNTAGVPKDTIERFNNNYKHYQDKIGKVTHSIVKNDLVSRSAQCKLGAGFKDLKKVDIMEVSNLGVYNILINHCDYIHSWTDNILPHKKMCCEHDERALKRYLYGMANSWTDLRGHINELVEESPIARIALAIMYIVGISFGNYQFKILGEGVLFMSTAAFATGMTMIHEASDSYTKGQITGSVSEIWDATSSKWYGTQILEGTG
jgi:hypothetical protein